MHIPCLSFAEKEDVMQTTQTTVVVVMLVLASMLVGCQEATVAARREIDRLSNMTRTADRQMQRVTKTALDTIASDEGSRRGKELRLANCPTSSLDQPASAPAHCKEIAMTARNRYESRVVKVQRAAEKVELAIDAMLRALLLSTDIVELASSAEDARRDMLLHEWTEYYGKLLALYKDVMQAYSAFDVVLSQEGVQ